MMWFLLNTMMGCFRNEAPIDPDHLYSLLRTILQQVKSHGSAWPFQKPVERSEAPDYYEHIKYPMGKSLCNPVYGNLL